MGLPMGPQDGEQARRQRHIAVLVALSGLDVQLHAVAVDLENLQAHAFQEPQAAAGDHAEANAVVGEPNQVDDLPDFIGAQDDRQILLARGTHKLQYSRDGRHYTP